MTSRSLWPLALLPLLSTPALAASGQVNINADLGITAPLISGPIGTVLDTPNDRAAQPYGGDLQLSVDWQFLAPLAIELAVTGGFQVVTPTINGYRGQPWGWSIEPHFAAGIGPRLRFLDDPDGGNLWIAAHVGAGYLTTFVVPVDLAVGYQFMAFERFSVGPFARAGVAFDFGGTFDPSFLVTVGVAASFDVLPFDRTPPPPPDRDGDGILDANDGAPDDPEDKDSFEDEDGIPEPDNDKDTVMDAQDRCPLEVGPPENQGCPIPDRDGDGIPDGNDLAPDVPEDKDGFEDEDGAPEPDNDKDNILDADDRCPLEAGVPEEKGCPVKDADKDGVPDRMDNCVQEAGPKDNQGCPKANKQLVIVSREKIEILDKVFFDTNKATIQKRSYGLLNQVASVLKDKAWIKKVQVEGHTDSQGKDDKNLTLSQARAESVRDYLVAQGVDTSRLVAIGFGEAQPIAPNTTAKGRAENRRVAFKVTESE